MTLATKEVIARKERTASANKYPPSTTMTRPSLQTRGRSTSISMPGKPKELERRPTGIAYARTSATNLAGPVVSKPPNPSRSRDPIRRPATPTAPVGAPGTARRLSKPSSAGTLLSQDQASLKPRTSTSSLQRPGSPAKSLAPKLSTSHLAPPSPSKLPSNIAASAEVSKLQAELLQLYLLHREAPVVEAEWRASAKQKLGDRFAKLSEESRDVSEQESAAQEKKNVLALRRWGSGGRLDEKIQSLESIITNVWSLSDPSGRYANLVRHFEKWIGGVSDMEEARRNGAMLAQGNNDLFIEDLDAQWKEERQELINQLDGWKQQLSDIDDLTLDEFYAEPPDEDEKSSLEKMLDGSRALINNMLAELRIMEVVEHEALLREDEWIGRMNRIGADDDFEIPRAGGAWKEI
ncbi:hypothetical protein M441DRAFT_134645 [Trichoderma asperellum CBS 433.97]|uniref:Uncharacterized protein n=1 Tax=Trichoderma asperellum (strain ATCC 204424 / CBS 433.97 / NBRC 101777) TaxID=1042311 RepID=A0A2T3ZEG3_TRIA4|nr:hypothetical protein M441DRAFT_134645 [Trichoderma asperellum CBS 433.97]PTB43198.1 hypothetical protein M441DRAFT_134645 [Trichoderma asperellum CBS 433.97]